MKVDDVGREVATESLIACLRTMCNEYTLKGGCGNVSLERIMSLMTCGSKAFCIIWVLFPA